MTFRLKWIVIIAACVAALFACAAKQQGPVVPKIAGSESGEWIRQGDKICKAGGGFRPIMVDIDGTAVQGNFVIEPKFSAVAHGALVSLDRKYGIVYLSANFMFDRIRKFFQEHKYPDAPLVTRPRNYWDSDYEDWCNNRQSWQVCEYTFKLDRMLYYRSDCGTPARWVGLGDKFSDYAAYVDAGACPVIVTLGSVHKVNEKFRAENCAGNPDSHYWFRKDGRDQGERCPIVPDRFIVPWEHAEAVIDGYLGGKVECGAWKLPASGTAQAAP
ncbi:MAG: hypothetical protein GMKNLPBB_00520 [Myxococcota bacterium]|nr:hypothetical protein [Myxococcota bacterium]